MNSVQLILKQRMLLFAIVSLSVLPGCQNDANKMADNVYPVPYGVDPMTVQQTAEGLPPREYVLSAGDTIDVKFFYTPELNETLVVRPDGKISLQIVGDVTAEGSTPIQLRGLLKRLYAAHLKEPEISVIVRTFSNQRVFVGGQVLKPGLIDMSDKMTALEAILEAGGIDYRQAEAQNVVVIRYHNGRRYGYKLDLEPVLDGEQTQPFFLEPKDIVYIPRTEIAKVNQWIDQYINKIIPQTGFFVTQRHGNTTIGIDTSSR